jgi:hypothetical protein
MEEKGKTNKIMRNRRTAKQKVLRSRSLHHFGGGGAVKGCSKRDVQLGKFSKKWHKLNNLLFFL